MPVKKQRTVASREATKALSTASVGRPTKYQPAYAEQARKLALLGLTDARMANFFEVSESTLNLWKKEHPEFSESIKAGKGGADAEVASTLFRSALGGGTITETREEVDEEGSVVIKRTVKELPANVTAQIFWLKNRQPHQWRDKVVLQDEAPPEVLADTANRFDKMMAKARERQRLILIERSILSEDGEA